jgi:hypothetical protein
VAAPAPAAAAGSKSTSKAKPAKTLAAVKPEVLSPAAAGAAGERPPPAAAAAAGTGAKPMTAKPPAAAAAADGGGAQPTVKPNKLTSPRAAAVAAKAAIATPAQQQQHSGPIDVAGVLKSYRAREAVQSPQAKALIGQRIKVLQNEVWKEGTLTVSGCRLHQGAPGGGGGWTRSFCMP